VTVVRGLGAFTAALALVGVAVWAWARPPAYPPLTVEERAAAMRFLRASLDGDDAATAPPGFGAFAAAAPDPLRVTLFVAGEPAARVDGRGATLGAALAAAARALAAAPVDAATRARGRIKLDLARGRAPIVTRIAPLFALSIVPGVDGVGVEVGGDERRLWPDELLAGDLLAANVPFPAAEFEIGADTRAVVRRLADGIPVVEWRALSKRFFRFGVESWIEPADPARRARDPAWRVVRGNVVDEAVIVVDPDHLRQAARAGGRYLLGQLADDGRFGYEYFTVGDQVSWGGSDYSLPRHAGGAYYLAQLYGVTHDPALLDGARRSIAYLAARSGGACDRPDRACIGDADSEHVDLGSTAMALLASAELLRVGGSDTGIDVAWARRLANFLVFMQKPDGDFCHLYRPRSDERDTRTKLLYYSGEALFALAKLLQAGVDDPRYVDALTRGLDHLTGAAYAYFAGQFFYGEDHWTCLAADAGWERLPPARRLAYARFCDGFASFLARQQFTADDAIVAAQPDFLGAYGFSPLLPPHATPVGSRSEALLSIYAMDRRRGPEGAAGARAARRQLLEGLGFLLRHQITDDAAYLMPAPDRARGGFLMSDVKRYVRIDFIQHACSAMLRAADLLW
jgi:hypothetical protein